MKNWNNIRKILNVQKDSRDKKQQEVVPFPKRKLLLRGKWLEHKALQVEVGLFKKSAYRNDVMISPLLFCISNRFKVLLLKLYYNQMEGSQSTQGLIIVSKLYSEGKISDEQRETLKGKHS